MTYPDEPNHLTRVQKDLNHLFDLRHGFEELLKTGQVPEFLFWPVLTLHSLYPVLNILQAAHCKQFFLLLGEAIAKPVDRLLEGVAALRDRSCSGPLQQFFGHYRCSLRDATGCAWGKSWGKVGEGA